MGNWIIRPKHGTGNMYSLLFGLSQNTPTHISNQANIGLTAIISSYRECHAQGDRCQNCGQPRERAQTRFLSITAEEIACNAIPKPMGLRGSVGNASFAQSACST